MHKTRILSLFLSSLFVGGCAYTQSKVVVNYNPAKITKGPLSSIPPLLVKIGDFNDKRPETDKIGYKIDNFGSKSASIVTTESLSDIVREAFSAEFTKNGHHAGITGGNIVVSGTINYFWFDYSYLPAEYIGTIGIEIKIIDGETGKELFTQSYHDNYNEWAGWLTKTRIERVMDTVLERLVFQVVTDPKLILALKSVAGVTPPQ